MGTRPLRQLGFTLLEVMCALAILGLTSGFTVVIWSESIEKAERAIDQRELREVADTLFGKIRFEGDEHNDGDSGLLDDAYGRWANLPQSKRDRYRIYRYSLSKKRVVAAGTAASSDSDAEDLFGGDDLDTTSADDTTTGDDEDASAAGVELWKITLRIFHAQDPEEEALITLQTYQRPRDTPGSGSSANTSTSSGQ